MARLDQQTQQTGHSPIIENVGISPGLHFLPGLWRLNLGKLSLLSVALCKFKVNNGLCFEGLEVDVIEDASLMLQLQLLQ